MHSVKIAMKGICFFILSAILFSTGGCKEEERLGLLFNHVLHTRENDLGCTDCHGPLKEGHYARPDHGNCLDCHSEKIETKEISEETCGFCHLNKDPGGSGPDRRKPSRGRGIFFHSPTLGTRCQECHQENPGESGRTARKMSREAVLRIREASHVSDPDCRICHKDMDKDTRPDSHHESWTRGHGAISRDPDVACAVCHPKNSCQECHQANKPASHNVLWVSKTHGLEGSWDRERCQTCHKEDSCVACHRQKQPRSHNSQWERIHGLQAQQDPASCRTCHPKDTCQSCHADSRPRSHIAQWDRRHGLQAQQDPASCRTCHPKNTCQSCHVDSRPQSHIAQWERRHGLQAQQDPASCRTCHPKNTCQACHQTVRPASHNAAWRDRHCLLCHDSQAGAEGCRTCHSNVNPDHQKVRIEHSPRPAPCLSCHDPVSGTAERLKPSSHPFLIEDQCLTCHYY